MNLIHNFPFFSLMIPMIAAVITLVLPGKWPRRFGILTHSVVFLLSVGAFLYTLQLGESYNYMMGHFPAPWGNEIRVGILEALSAVFYGGIILLDILSGITYIREELDDASAKMYMIFLDLILGSVLALIYTNDLFNAYVFIEINTIAACGLIVVKKNGPSYVAATRYMIMSLLGSGIFILGICFIYTITGHLLMENIGQVMQQYLESGQYPVPILMSIVLLSAGLTIKSGLFPFHTWMPGAYAFTVPTSSAILSGVVSKSYIFLLIKILYRVIGENIARSSRVTDILFVFAIIGIIYGSVAAIREKDIRYMNAYSSVAQIAYVYMGVGMGNQAGMVAAVFHMFMHAATKSLIFLTAEGLIQASGHSTKILHMKGSGFRNRIAGVGYTVGGLSMIGIPLFAGFISKLAFATAVSGYGIRLILVLVVLAVSTLLNAVYFIHVIIVIYTPADVDGDDKPVRSRTIIGTCAVGALIALNFILGMFAGPLMDWINRGFAMFV